MIDGTAFVAPPRPGAVLAGRAPVSAGPRTSGRGMRRLCALAVLLIAGSGCQREAGTLAPDHPVVGTWTVSTPNGTCTETYRFAADGTVLVTSGDEVAEVRSELAAKPSPAGFYRWRHTVEKHNGKPDCRGRTLAPGHAATWFLQLHPSQDMMIMCREESTAACFGPLHRAARGVR
jgi:hypothetical protein